MKFLALGLIKFYKCFLSPLFPPSCRFYPTCSQYAIDSIVKFGLIQGGWLSIKRISKCHPFHIGGIDPVPTKIKTRTKNG